MEVDINLFIEKRDKDTGKWHALSTYYDAVYEGRDYGLFGLLAGVRSTSGMLQPVRGLPEDVSDELRKLYNEYDYFPYESRDEYGYFSATYYDFCELELASYIMSQWGEFLVEYGLASRDCGYYLVSMSGVEIADSIGYNLNQFDSLASFIDDVKKFIRSHDGCDVDKIVPNDYRIVMWFDCCYY